MRKALYSASRPGLKSWSWFLHFLLMPPSDWAAMARSASSGSLRSAVAIAGIAFLLRAGPIRSMMNIALRRFCVSSRQTTG